MYNNSDMGYSYKQTRDYNCAAGAVVEFVRTQSGLELDVETVTERLRCDPETGTPHGSIVGYLDFLFRYEGVEIQYGHDIRLSEVTLPMLVNYWTVDDGHYGVIIDMRLDPTGGWVNIADPSTGTYELQDWNEFVENWYSKRYGPTWGLYIARKA
jgi:hypothetical protein